MDIESEDMNDLVNVQVMLLTVIEKMIEDGVNPLAVAAMMSNISLRMYRTLLPDGDYDAMVDVISNSRYRIEPLTQNTKTH